LRDAFDKEFGKERSRNVKRTFHVLEFNVIDLAYFFDDVCRADNRCCGIGLDSRSTRSAFD
jgi:hypothetical protein